MEYYKTNCSYQRSYKGEYAPYFLFEMSYYRSWNSHSAIFNEFGTVTRIKIEDEVCA